MNANGDSTVRGEQLSLVTPTFSASKTVTGLYESTTCIACHPGTRHTMSKRINVMIDDDTWRFLGRVPAASGDSPGGSQGTDFQWRRPRTQLGRSPRLRERPQDASALRDVLSTRGKPSRRSPAQRPTVGQLVVAGSPSKRALIHASWSGVDFTMTE